MCPQVKSRTCSRSHIYQKVSISFWQIFTMGGWFLGRHLYSCCMKLQKKQSRPIWTSNIKRMGGVWLESTAQLEFWYRTERPVHSGLASLFLIAKYMGYQSSWEQNLCSCYLTFVTPPATTWKLLMHQKKDKNQSRDEQWIYKRILNWSCHYFRLAELMISIISCYSDLCQISLISSSKN